MSLFLWWKFPTNALKSQQTTLLDLRYSLALSCKVRNTFRGTFWNGAAFFLFLRIARLRALSLTWWRWRLPSMWSFQLGQWRQLSTWYDTWRPRFLYIWLTCEGMLFILVYPIGFRETTNICMKMKSSCYCTTLQVGLSCCVLEDWIPFNTSCKLT